MLIKINLLRILVACLGCCHVFPQQPSPLSFFPFKEGDVWQYRSEFTGEIVRTRYNDKDSIDSEGNIYVRGRSIAGSYITPLFEKIDTSYNVYNLYFQSDYPRYKLAADSGESWVAGTNQNDTTIVKVLRIYQSNVFGVPSTIKVFSFEIVHPPPQQPTWIGNDYLASGFGLVQTDIEPSDVYYLSGAILDSVSYGVITGVTRQDLTPQEFTLHQNYPNPFNGSTVISFSISSDTHVNITTYDVLGRTLKTLVDERKKKGDFQIHFEGTGMTSGLYFAVMKTKTTTLIQKLVYLR